MSFANLWHVLHTLPRQEKAVARDLDARGLTNFLPLRRKMTCVGRRKIESTVPLFPGYVFLHSAMEQAYEVDRAGRVAQIIRVADQQQFEFEIEQIRKAIDAGAELTPYRNLPVGRSAEVRTGPLQGIVGVVEEHKEMNRLILRIKTLGQAVSLDIDAELLEAIDYALSA
jgi:transcriptional antiterminator RfaH